MHPSNRIFISLTASGGNPLSALIGVLGGAGEAGGTGGMHDMFLYRISTDSQTAPGGASEGNLPREIGTLTTKDIKSSEARTDPPTGLGRYLNKL